MIDVRAELSRSLVWKMMVVLVIKGSAALFAMFVFAKFSPLVDAELYLKGALSEELAWRTRMVNTLASLLNQFGGAWFAHWAFGMLSTAGLVYYFSTGGTRWAMALMLLFPSSFVWTSIVGKEALFVGGFTLTLVIWAKYALSEIERRDRLVLVCALAVCAGLRPHYASSVAWLFVSMFVVKRLGSNSWPILLAMWLLAAVAVYYVAWPELLRRGFGGLDPFARASRFGLLAIEPETGAGFQRFKMFMPLGMLIGIIGPLPHEVYSRSEFLPFLMEGVLILLTPYLIYRYGIARLCEGKDRDAFRRIFGWCLAPAILAVMILHAPLGILNPGSATRWRTNFESLFYLAPLLLLFQFVDREPHENSSLSH